MSIKIDHNFGELEVYLSKKHKSAMNKASRRAITRGLRSAQKQSTIETRKEYKIKVRDIKADQKIEKHFKGRPANKQYGLLKIRKRSIDLIKFTRSTQQRPKQKGIPIRRRRPLRITIKPGRPTKIKAFIRKSVRGSGNQVFKRVGQGWYKQAVPGSYNFYKKRAFRTPILKAGAETASKEFISAMNFYIRKMGAK